VRLVRATPGIVALRSTLSTMGSNVLGNPMLATPQNGLKCHNDEQSNNLP
jgi:hypothetical protein